MYKTHAYAYARVCACACACAWRAPDIFTLTPRTLTTIYTYGFTCGNTAAWKPLWRDGSKREQRPTSLLWPRMSKLILRSACERVQVSVLYVYTCQGQPVTSVMTRARKCGMHTWLASGICHASRIATSCTSSTTLLKSSDDASSARWVCTLINSHAGDSLRRKTGAQSRTCYPTLTAAAFALPRLPMVPTLLKAERSPRPRWGPKRANLTRGPISGKGQLLRGCQLPRGCPLHAHARRASWAPRMTARGGRPGEVRC